MVTDDDDGFMNDDCGFWYFLYEEIPFGILTWVY
jgi:hypothetical protein